MKSGVFAVAGRIGSGKTSVACLLGKLTGAPITSFSRTLKDLAQSQDIEPSREALQALGAVLVRESPEHFCQAVLDQANWHGGDLIVDGLRHLEIARILQTLVSPARLWIVYVEASFEIRRRRVIAEAGVDLLTGWDTQASEQSLPDLHVRSDVIITNEGSVAELRSRVAEWLAS